MEGSPGRCPRCEDAPLRPRRAGRIAVGLCAGCRGLWLDGVGLLDLLMASDVDLERLENADSGEPQDGPVVAIPCPRCGVDMNREVGGSDIAIDICRSHGIWFDRGELQAMLGYVRTGVKPGESEPGKRGGLLGFLAELF